MSRLKVILPAIVVAVAGCADSPGARSLAPTADASFSSGSGNSGSSGRVQKLELRDDCDAATFNVAIGAGTCVGRGGTTFDKFIAELQKKQIAGAWKNNPDHFGDKAGTAIDVTNIGGETHSFTRVAAFGGGIVPLLNDLSGNTTVAAECADLNPATLVPSGGHLHVDAMAAGTYKFQCCIHPWMRTSVTLKAN
jgi:plastocyanin